MGKEDEVVWVEDKVVLCTLRGETPEEEEQAMAALKAMFPPAPPVPPSKAGE